MSKTCSQDRLLAAPQLGEMTAFLLFEIILQDRPDLRIEKNERKDVILLSFPFLKMAGKFVLHMADWISEPDN